MGGGAHPNFIADQGRGTNAFKTMSRLRKMGQGIGHYGMDKSIMDAIGTYEMLPDGGGWHNRNTVDTLARELGPWLAMVEQKHNDEQYAKKQARLSANQSLLDQDNNHRQSYQKYIDEAKKLKGYIHAERGKVDNLSYSPYQGQTTADKSSLTKRAEDLESKHSKPFYSHELEELKNKFNSYNGLKYNHETLINDYMNERNDNLKRENQDRFKASFKNTPSNNRVNNMNALQDQKIGEYQPVFEESLDNWNNLFNLENKRNTLKNYQAAFEGSKNLEKQHGELIKTLKDTGDKDTGISNMKLKADEQNFYNQQAQNIMALKNLEEASHPVINYGDVVSNEMEKAKQHALRRKAILDSEDGSIPDIGSYNYQALKNSYAPTVNADALKSTYEQQRYSTPQMKVADKNSFLSDIQERFKRAEISPSSYQNDQMQNLIKNSGNYADNVVNSSIDFNRRRNEYEDKKFLKELNAEVLALGNKKGRMANSKSHMSEAENLIAQRMSERDIERKNNFMTNMDREKLLNNFSNEIDTMGFKLASVGDAATNAHFLDRLRKSHDEGYGQWNRDQDKEEENYKNQVDSQSYMWPGLKSLYAANKYNINPLSRINSNFKN